MYNFRFENYWIEYEDFLPLVESVWQQTIFYNVVANIVDANTGRKRGFRPAPLVAKL
jgi:hypothetical protein